MRKGSLILAFAVVLSLVGCGGSGSTSSLSGGDRIMVVPVSISLSPATAAPGAEITFVVDVNEVVSTPTSVGISASPADAFSDLPSSVLVPAGSRTVTFTAHLSSTSNGNYSVTATRGAVAQTSTGRAMWGN